MKTGLIFILLAFVISNLSGQEIKSEEMFKEYFNLHKDSLDPIEGIWTVATTQEYSHFDTVYDVIKYSKAARVAVVKKGEKFESYNLTGESYDVQFSLTDVKGVYLYRNFFKETNDFSKTQAVISKVGEMQYTYEFPDDFIRQKLGDSYEEGTRVVNILVWTKTYPETVRKK